MTGTVSPTHAADSMRPGRVQGGGRADRSCRRALDAPWLSDRLTRHYRAAGSRRPGSGCSLSARQPQPCPQPCDNRAGRAIKARVLPRHGCCTRTCRVPSRFPCCNQIDVNLS